MTFDPRLERAYRRLLLAYPGPYRRRRGAEIVTTLLEMAEPGRRRPSAADTWHVLASGVRQRFRLPAGGPVLLVAMLALLAGGALGAAGGSWVAERTFAALPDQVAARQLQEQIAQGETHVGRDDGSPWWGDFVYGSTQIGGSGWDPGRVRQLLVRQGWHVGAVEALDGASFTTGADGSEVRVPLAGSAFRAERDGIQLDVRGFMTDRDGSVDLQVSPVDNGTLLPFTVLGGLLGLALGWLLAASGRLVLVLGGALTLALPAVALYGNVMRAVRYAGDPGPVFTVHSALTPGPYWPFGPPWLNAVLAGTGLVLVLAALVVPAHPAAPARTVLG